MNLDLQDKIQLWMYFDLYDVDELKVLRNLLRPGDVFLDIGAHVGWYTLHAAQLVGPSGRVDAFEALPANANALKANVERNGFQQVWVNACAVSDKSGEIDLYAPPKGESGWGSAVASDKRRKLTVPALTIDEYMSSRLQDRPVRLAKLDIEGHEPYALKGMLETLRRNRPALLLEMNCPMLERAGYTPDYIRDLLEPLGYKAKEITYGGGLRACGYSTDPADVANLLLQTDC